MKKILFQGDSITDCLRNRECDEHLGYGYATMVAGMISINHPGEFKFYNRGIGGNRMVDVYARIKKDVINLKPDYMSILIGVNDVWHEILEENGTTPDKFYKLFCMFIEEVQEALPDLKIIIMGPYILRGTATDANWDRFRDGTAEIGVMVRKVAEKYNIPYVDLDPAIKALADKTSSEYVLLDGVHAAIAGNAVIAELLTAEFEKLF